MKKILICLILLVTTSIYSQTIQENYDYFVQFNGNKLTKKITVADFLNHPLIKKYNVNNDDLNLSDIANFIRFDEKITVHGNLTDSIPFYQITIPIKNRAAVKDFLLRKIDREADSISKKTIQDFPNYSIVHHKNKSASVAFNDNYLVILEFTKKYTYDDYLVNEEKQDSLSIYQEEPEAIDADTTVITEEYSNYLDDYDTKFVTQKEAFEQMMLLEQNSYLQTLFQNEFKIPTSSKINNEADISSWINYSSAISNLNSIYGLAGLIGYDKLISAQKSILDMVKGINIDLYFDNDNARIEEIIEYAKPIADIMSKITNRKINKNIFKYFPKEKPLGYFSYHLNTEEALKNIPNMTEAMFKNSSLFKDDASLITDLISTMIDEKATSTLFDGDLSLFLYDFKDQEITKKVYTYDENYESIEKEVTKTESIPMFAMVFTSTHPTFGDKLIQLGLRKEALIAHDGHYDIPNTEKYGNLFILKDGDVVVLGNSVDYFDSENNGSFVKNIKKDYKKNYLTAKMDLNKTFEVYKKTKNGNSINSKTDQIALMFKEVSISSPKKLTDNKLKIEFKLTSKKNNKNIILQTLDLAESMN